MDNSQFNNNNNNNNNSQSDGHSATDIITYIGVPLAVLGVLPILYNTAVTLANVSRIKRMLRHAKLTALTRSDVVNRVIEVELPRYAVRPMDRFTDRAEYWSISSHRSAIPGGSWTTFNWRTNVIGLITQRLEYADQLRQPQVDIAFDELVCYLLDLGAIPDPHGWKLLRSTGLWTPVGCALMKSPDGREKALTIAPLDGSDGHLSLSVSWDGQWTTRDYTKLPPYWVRLPPRRVRVSVEEDVAAGAGGSNEKEKKVSLEEDQERKEPDDAERDGGGDGAAAAASSSSSSSLIQKPSMDSVQRQGNANSRLPITCQISSEGIVTALCQMAELQSTVNLDSLYIEHVRVRANKSNGAWFASAATAYGTTSQTVLWNYKIPDDILNFSRRQTVPCGVMVVIGMVDECETPEWATKPDSGDQGAKLDLFSRRHREKMVAMQAEAKMPPAQRAQAAQERIRKENEDRLQDMRDQMRLDQQRREVRILEALQSPRWDAKRVAESCLAWLKKENELFEEEELKEVVGGLLHRMVLDGQFTTAICQMLDLWKAWAENGGMRKSDLTSLSDDKTTFAYASLLVAVIRDTTTAQEGTLSLDLQECLRLWKTVRLG